MAVAYDASSSNVEEGGDKVISTTHVGTGSDLGVFAGSGGYGSGAGLPTTSITYGGTSMTEVWDQTTDVNSNLFNAGYHWPGGSTVPSGSQTVTATIGAGTTSIQFIQVITMTGVHQTTPVGTAATEASFHTSPWSVTVGSVGADDLVVDNGCFFGTGTPAVGANQTNPANNQQVDAGGTVFSRASYQDGVDGGVMSWSQTGSLDGFLGAIAFKPAAAGAAAVPIGHGMLLAAIRNAALQRV